MNMRIIYSLAVSLVLYAGAAVGMMNRAAQQATKRVTTAACRLATPSMRPTIANAPSAGRGFATQSTWKQPNIPRYADVSALSRRSMSTFSTDFKKPWLTGATPWQILGISSSASYKDAQKAYRAIIQQVHPDKNLNNLAAATQASQEANDALKWFKQDPNSRTYTTQNTATNSTQEPTEEQKRKDQESYEYYQKRAGGAYSYASYKQRSSNALYALYGVLIATGLVAATDFTARKAGEWLSEKAKIKEFKKLITQTDELYTEFEKQKFPLLLVEQFTLELEELTNQAPSKLDEAKNRQERINLLWEYNFLLERTLRDQRRILTKYVEDPGWNAIISSYEKAYFEHKKTFENSPRRNFLRENTYELPQSTDPNFVWFLDLKMVLLESETAREKAQQEKERKKQNLATKQNYTDWAKSNVYYYWNKLKNATGQAN